MMCCQRSNRYGWVVDGFHEFSVRYSHFQRVVHSRSRARFDLVGTYAIGDLSDTKYRSSNADSEQKSDSMIRSFIFCLWPLQFINLILLFVCVFFNNQVKNVLRLIIQLFSSNPLIFIPAPQPITLFEGRILNCFFAELLPREQLTRFRWSCLNSFYVPSFT